MNLLTYNGKLNIPLELRNTMQRLNNRFPVALVMYNITNLEVKIK